MKELSNTQMEQFESSYKIGLIATICEDGDPHISLISSLQANSPKQLIFGQYIEGLSKKNPQNNNKMGFLVMSFDKKYWLGKGKWTHKAIEGPEYEMYNKKPLYRYNSYFGVHTVHYMDLVELSEESNVDIKKIAIEAVKVKLLKRKIKGHLTNQVLKPWAEELLSNLTTLTFIAYVDSEGYPIIKPIISAQAVNMGSFTFLVDSELAELQEQQRVAIFGMNLETENVLVKGPFSKLGKKGGYINIDKVYNSMPPKQGYIFPKNKVEAIREFI